MGDACRHEEVITFQFLCIHEQVPSLISTGIKSIHHVKQEKYPFL